MCHGQGLGRPGLGGGAGLTVRLGSAAEGEADGQSQPLEEDEELRGCLGRQQANKVRTVGGCLLWRSRAWPGPLMLLPLFCGDCAHSGTGATMWGRPCCTEPASRASCAVSRTS